MITLSAEAHARVMKKLLPPSRMWSPDPGSLLSLVFLAAGEELARVSGRSADIIEEADSSTTTELIEDFERELLLPSTGTDQERRDRIVALETREQRSRPPDISSALAPYLDLDAADVDVIERSRADAIAIGDDRAIYHFHVYRDPALSGTPDIDSAQAELDKIAHSHTLGRVCESIAFKVGDPYSLVGRDILGA
ncbi:MAG: DUF2313 domain-containing protein [Myxococcales bacterium]|nr:DUF2313 domain-containing protein [Myxococcales bacterium]